MKKKIYIFLCLSFLFCNLSAQKQKVKNQPYGDQKLYHFGISIGLNYQDILLINNGIPTQSGETWFATIPNYSPGFSVGLISDLYLNPYMNLRFTPMLHFGDKIFEFVEPKTKQNFKTSIRSNYVTVPLDLKIRSLRLNNYRPYIITGAYAAIDMGRKPDEAVYLKAIDYGLSIGLGCDFYFPIIKVIPELRFSFGLVDIFNHNRTDLTDESLRKYSDSISKGTTRMISLILNFE
ncbi:MAG: PorT family protein [Dysgonamonadaceae bacterium]|jgi:hypothetical protein|nr:PorT family protein [Dysgonamonadaceae bacterium]